MTSLLEFLIKGKEALSLIAVLSVSYQLFVDRVLKIKAEYDTKLEMLQKVTSLSKEGLTKEIMELRLEMSSSKEDLKQGMEELKRVGVDIRQNCVDIKEANEKGNFIFSFVKSYIFVPIYYLFSIIPKEVWVALIYIVAGLSVTIYLTYMFKNSLFVEIFGTCISFVSETMASFFGKGAIVSLTTISDQLASLNAKVTFFNEESKNLMLSLLQEVKQMLEFSINSMQDVIVKSTANSNEVTIAGFNSLLTDMSVKDKLVRECIENLYKQNIRLSDEVINVIVQSISKTLEKDLSQTASFVLNKLSLENRVAPGSASSLVSTVMDQYSNKSVIPMETALVDSSTFVNQFLKSTFGDDA